MTATHPVTPPSGGDMKAAVIGLGKLGLPLAVALRGAGLQVWGCDTDERLVSELAAGRHTRAWEPGCHPNGYAGIHFTTDCARAVAETDIALVCVNTPARAGGGMDLSQVGKAVGQAVTAASGRTYTIAVCSTLTPDAFDWIPQAKEGVTLVSSPVWVALGSVVKDLETPPVVLVGCDGPHPGGHEGCHATLARLWATVTEGRSHAMVTDRRTAAFLKLAHNAWCCVKMAWLGWLGDNAATLGIDVGSLSEFMAGGGERPGRFWRYGPPFGGPCFPRDLRYFSGFCRAAAGSEPLARAAARVNRERLAGLAARVAREAAGRPVVIVGRPYKTGVPVDDGSVSLALRDELAHLGLEASFWPEAAPRGAVWCVMHEGMRHMVPRGAAMVDAWEQPPGGGR